jgi:hypothetical protein
MQIFSRFFRWLILSTILIFFIYQITAAQIGYISYGDDTDEMDRQQAQDNDRYICTPSMSGCDDEGPKPLERVFFDDFESGRPNPDWDLQDGWSVMNSNGKYVLRGKGHKFAALEGNDINNLAFRADFKKKNGGLHVNFRSNFVKDRVGKLQRYFVSVDGDTLGLTKQLGTGTGAFNDLVGTKLNLDNEWHSIEIRAKGGNIRVLIDGDLCICYRDNNPINNGGISFETPTENSEFLIDNVGIFKI